jgi:hypothetical protein
MDISRFPIHQFSIHQSADGTFEVMRAVYDDEAEDDTRYRISGGHTREEAEEILRHISAGQYDVPGPEDVGP